MPTGFSPLLFSSTTTILPLYSTSLPHYSLFKTRWEEEEEDATILLLFLFLFLLLLLCLTPPPLLFCRHNIRFWRGRKGFVGHVPYCAVRSGIVGAEEEEEEEETAEVCPSVGSSTEGSKKKKPLVYVGLVAWDILTHSKTRDLSFLPQTHTHIRTHKPTHPHSGWSSIERERLLRMGCYMPLPSLSVFMAFFLLFLEKSMFQTDCVSFPEDKQITLQKGSLRSVTLYEREKKQPVSLSERSQYSWCQECRVKYQCLLGYLLLLLWAECWKGLLGFVLSMQRPSVDWLACAEYSTALTSPGNEEREGRGREERETKGPPFDRRKRREPLYHIYSFFILAPR